MTQIPVPFNQLDTWEQALHEGNLLLKTGETAYAQAEAAEADHRWRTAVEHYRSARKAYTEAITRLEAPAAIGDTSFKAIRVLRDAAQSSLARAQTLLQQLDEAKRAEGCENHIQSAAALLQQARSALHEDDFINARALANQASTYDPLLTPEAEHLIRQVDESQQANGSRYALIGIGIVAILIIIIAVSSLQLWTRIDEFLFPDALILLLTSR